VRPGGCQLSPQEQQDGGDPPVHGRLLGEAELREDGVDVLLDRPSRQHQRVGDGGVVLAGRDLCQHLELPRGEVPQR